MTLVANLAVLIVAALHAGFFVLESILWTKPFGRRVFGLSRELADATKSLALNQGVYNLFLAAGLVWGVLAGTSGFQIKMFFLACVVIAGIVGAATAKRSILWIQAVPALVAAALVWLTQR